tara:strand:+ start:563 stop:2476 length:1914 start_codon:yes stop_codon:yes gene_type:complete
MAEKIISPGVFTKEIDQTFLPAAVGDIGAAVVGPTVKGPALVPTVVDSFGDYEQRFGTSFKSGSVGGSYFQYLTSHTVQEYFRNGNLMTVVRVLDGAFTNAVGSIPTGSLGSTGFHGVNDNANATASAYTDYDANVKAISFKLHTHADGAIMNSVTPTKGGLEDTAVDTGTHDKLISGSKHNLRWEISNRNDKKGTFTLLIRRGDDTEKRKSILETWNNLSLDPNTSNYLPKVVGDTKLTLRGTTLEPYIQPSGSFANKSKYVYTEIIHKTPDYLDVNGNVSATTQGAGGIHHISMSLPAIVSGGFTDASNGYAGYDALGSEVGTSTSGNYVYYENISTETQGFTPNDSSNNGRGYDGYVKALNLLKNQDEYDINLIFLPGILNDKHPKIVNKAIDVCEERGDCFVVVDPCVYGSAITTATTQAESLDSSYAAAYWPWVQINDTEVGTPRWVPPSVTIAGAYTFNDKVAHPWFAPAGLNRGGLDSVIQAERKLTHANRDTLYDSNVNPIATFPAQGVVVWGQKTLQKKPSALDRVNVRRLLIKVKKFIASSSRFLVFEQNNAATRARFLNIVNPYLEQVQANSGLNAFRVVMDDSNNTPDVVDRNILYGQIFVQPTRTAEFIVLDFTVQPTGATFPE